MGSAAAAADRPAVQPFPEPPPLAPSDWQLAAQVSRVRRWLAASAGPADATQDAKQAVRVDDPHRDLAPPWPNGRSAYLEGCHSAGSFIAGVATWLGLTATICGLALSAQALVLDRENLWPIGLLLFLAGLAAMAPGLAFALTPTRAADTRNRRRAAAGTHTSVGWRP